MSDNNSTCCPRTRSVLLKSQVNIVTEQTTERKLNLRILEIIALVGFIIFIFTMAFIYSLDNLYEYSAVKGVVTTKVTGVVWAREALDTGAGRAWDVTDIVIPPRGPDEFLVLTHILPPLQQRQDACDENPSVNGIQCQTDADCQAKKGMILKGSQGPITGSCIPSTMSNVSVCQILAWCPISNYKWQSDDGTILYETKDWTVMIESDIEFSQFHIDWGNHKNLGHLTDVDDFTTPTCLYDEDDQQGKFCPIFKLGTIVEGAGEDYENLARMGGIIRIVIKWDCNLKSDLDECSPKYIFKRMDRISTGYDIRYIKHKGGNGRELNQAHGIRFLVNLEGRGKKYAHSKALKTLGSYLAYSAGVTFVLYQIVFRFFGYNKIESYMKNTDELDPGRKMNTTENAGQQIGDAEDSQEYIQQSENRM